MQTATRRERTAAPVERPGLATKMFSLYRRFVVWRARRWTIEQLHSLDAHTLKDIGLARSDIEATVHAITRESEQDAHQAPTESRSRYHEGALAP